MPYSISSTSWDDNTIAASTTYYYLVEATNVNGTSPASNQASATSAAIVPATATPTFNVPAGSYTTVQTVTISDATSGAVIYYTTDGSTPGVQSSTYSGPITVSSSETLQAIAQAPNFSASAVASAIYTITLPTPAPTINSLAPAIATAGGAAFTLTVNGSGYVAGSTVYWGPTALATTFVSTTQLTAAVTAGQIASSGATAVSVQSPQANGNFSNAMIFEVDTNNASSSPTIPTTTATVTAGNTASYPVTLPSSVSNVSVTCLNLTAGASCGYSSANNTVTIATSSTTPKGNYQVTVVFSEAVTVVSTSYVLLPFLLLPLILIRKRLMAKKLWMTVSLALLLLSGMGLLISCGGSSKSTGSTTTSNSTTTSQSTTSSVVTLTVQ
jgi:hypothetical protein